MTLRDTADQIIRASLRAVQPDAAVQRALQEFSCAGRVVLIAIGKAAWAMANAAWDTLSTRITSGAVITKYGHSRGPIGPLQIFEAGHPVPDEAGLRAAQAALELNNVFAAAQAAADDYLHSVQASLADTNATAANRHMIDANAIAKMKNGVVLINTARGTLIDPEALVNGLESGKIGAAGLDVVENENGLFYFNHMGDALQNRELAMLRSFPNVIFTPHTAFYTDVNVASMVRSGFEELTDFAAGRSNPCEVPL